jgi:hypothetical protein
MGKNYYKWPFSIAMLNYQRVMVVNDGAIHIIDSWEMIR